jgi:hypothetical protein
MGFDQLADALGHQARRQILVELMEHNPLSESGLEGSGVSEIELITVISRNSTRWTTSSGTERAKRS